MRRRAFLGGLSLTGVAAFVGLAPRSSDAEPPPETTRLRLVQAPGICPAPQFVAGELLHDEGFADLQYVKTTAKGIAPALSVGQADVSMHFAAPLVLALDAGYPIVILSGGHAGCFELFGTDRVRAIRDLKGKRVAVPELGVGPHLLLSIMLAHVGLDPRTEVNWVIHPSAEGMRLLGTRDVDAYMGFPPDPQQLRAKGIGHVVVNSAVDRPHPVATKRAVRGILKAADLCALQPEWAARALVDKGFTPRYDYALQTLKDVPYNRWRELSPEDTLRFYALRLHEAGFIKATPQKIIAQGTDWRFLNALKRELKG